MPYFNLFVVGAWAFAFGWFFGAIHEQNHNNKPADQRLPEKPEAAALVEMPRDAVSSSAAAD